MACSAGVDAGHVMMPVVMACSCCRPTGPVGAPRAVTAQYVPRPRRPVPPSPPPQPQRGGGGWRSGRCARTEYEYVNGIAATRYATILYLCIAPTIKHTQLESTTKKLPRGSAPKRPPFQSTPPGLLTLPRATPPSLTLRLPGDIPTAQLETSLAASIPRDCLSPPALARSVAAGTSVAMPCECLCPSPVPPAARRRRDESASTPWSTVPKPAGATSAASWPCIASSPRPSRRGHARLPTQLCRVTHWAALLTRRRHSPRRRLLDQRPG